MTGAPREPKAPLEFLEAQLLAIGQRPNSHPKQRTTVYIAITRAGALRSIGAKCAVPFALVKQVSPIVQHVQMGRGRVVIFD